MHVTSRGNCVLTAFSRHQTAESRGERTLPEQMKLVAMATRQFGAREVHMGLDLNLPLQRSLGSLQPFSVNTAEIRI